MPAMNPIRDRVKELRRVKAKELVPNEKNWRRHSPEQRAALDGVLKEVGFAGAILARVLPDGRLGIVDGHLRTDMDPEMIVPVLVLDVNEEEADKLLLTYDPIGAMAERDDKALAALLASVSTEDEAIRGLLESMKPIDFSIPEDNKSIDESAMACTENECPKCGFKW